MSWQNRSYLGKLATRPGSAASKDTMTEEKRRKEGDGGSEEGVSKSKPGKLNAERQTLSGFLPLD